MYEELLSSREYLCKERLFVTKQLAGFLEEALEPGMTYEQSKS
jgi:hypothetical protein